MKLFWGPNTCAIGTHIVLEETGAPYTLERVDVFSGEHLRPPYATLNPKQKVPALLRDDGSLLTEYGAISVWLARTHPGAALLGPDADTEARAIEAMEYVTGTIHPMGFIRVIVPRRFSRTDAVEDVQGKGRHLARKGFDQLERQLADRDWIAGPYTVADPAVFYVTNWAERAGIELPPALASHRERMRARPAVGRVLAVWDGAA